MPAPWILAAIVIAGAAESPPVLAVFELRDAEARLLPEQRMQLTRYLRVRLTEHAGFPVVPEAELKQALRREQAESLATCYDEACQIEIGREVAAQKSLALDLVVASDACILTATLFDLVRATSERAASVRSSCDVAALTGAVDELVARLRPQAAADESGTEPRPELASEGQPVPAARGPTRSGEVRVTTYDREHAFDVTLYGEGTSPTHCTPRLSSGEICRLGVGRLGEVQLAVRNEEFGVAEVRLALDEQHRLAAVDVSVGYSLGGYLWLVSGSLFTVTGVASLLTGVGVVASDAESGSFLLVNGAVFGALGLGALVVGLIWPQELLLDEHILP
jgi:hypothetical protein